MTKSLKKCISSPNDSNIVGIRNMLQRDKKCMQNSSRRKLEENIKTDLKSIGKGNGLDSSG